MALLSADVLGFALAMLPALGQQPPWPSVPNEACHPAALHDYCRVGCSEPQHAVETHHVTMALTHVRKPPPSGVVILEIGVDLTGKVVSACVKLGVRDDFDKAAQTAALASQWKIPAPPTGVRGYVLTITECTPEPECKQRPILREK
jgi:hypothetical protein